jgi:hypothetical protein
LQIGDASPVGPTFISTGTALYTSEVRSSTITFGSATNTPAWARIMAHRSSSCAAPAAAQLVVDVQVS